MHKRFAQIGASNAKFLWRIFRRRSRGNCNYPSGSYRYEQQKPQPSPEKKEHEARVNKLAERMTKNFDVIKERRQVALEAGKAVIEKSWKDVDVYFRYYWKKIREQHNRIRGRNFKARNKLLSELDALLDKFDAKIDEFDSFYEEQQERIDAQQKEMDTIPKTSSDAPMIEEQNDTHMSLEGVRGFTAQVGQETFITLPENTDAVPSIEFGNEKNDFMLTKQIPSEGFEWRVDNGRLFVRFKHANETARFRVYDKEDSTKFEEYSFYSKGTEQSLEDNTNPTFDKVLESAINRLKSDPSGFLERFQLAQMLEGFNPIERNKRIQQVLERGKRVVANDGQAYKLSYSEGDTSFSIEKIQE